MAQGSAATLAAKQVSVTLPIVMAYSSDPVEAGLVAGLARPGGNVTGLAAMDPEITPKRMEILKATVPRAIRYGVLWATTSPSYLW